jgi:hypothetical protein
MKYHNVLFVKVVSFTVMLLMGMVCWAQTTVRAFELAGPNGPNVSLNAVALAIATAETMYQIETNGTKYSQNPELSKEDFDMFYQMAMVIQEDLDDGVPIDAILNGVYQNLPRSMWRDSLSMFYHDARQMFRNRWDSTGQRKR